MKKTNVIYILSDQHNALVMGNAGDPYVRTPNLDWLYANGTGLDRCYCSAPLCVPSRASILTGLLPSHTGVCNNMQCLRSDRVTMVHNLAVSGYETVLSGRMHFVGKDQRHGYEKRFVGDMTPSAIGVDNEYSIYGEFMRSSGQNTTSLRKSGSGNSAVLLFDRDVTDAACDFLKKRTDERPLFLTVGFYGPHCPYIAPKELYQYYYECLPELPREICDEKKQIHPAIRKWYQNRQVEEVDAETVRRVRAAYYAMVEYMDGLIGEILETVRETIGLEDTMIVYGSDHGDNIGEHGLFWKTNFYEGAARVPLVFAAKGRIPCGQHIRELTSLVDLAPTLLAFTEADALPECDGVDLKNVILGKEEADSNRMVLSYCSDIKGDEPSVMLCEKNYKYVEHAGYEVPQLFDLEADPMELRDLGNKVPDGGAYMDLILKFREKARQIWNADEARRELNIAKKNYELLKKFNELYPPEPIEEYQPDIASNYLDEM